MSSKIEVSRGTIERILTWLNSDEPDDDGWVAELRALLAAPVVERQREIDGVNCQNPECSALIPHGSKCGYCALPELAELQATIARLTADGGERAAEKGVEP